jgi:ribosomal protein L17
MKNLFEFYRRQILISFVGILFILLNCQVALAQFSNEKKQSAKTANQKSENPNMIRWKIFLDSLAQEARTVFPEERRPYAVVEVANAYWEIDREVSRSLYISALDSAWSLTEQDRKNRAVLNHILSSATKLDSALAKTLTKRLIDKEDSDSDKDEISSSTALEILKDDPSRAAQLAEAFAPNGLQYGAATFFMYRLAAQDIQLSNRVYEVYLTKVSASENIPLELILPLGGYAFGYAEFYNIDRKGQLSGATYPPVKGLSANPAFTNAFLNLAYRRIARTIERRKTAIGSEIESLNYPILFALEYLMPEVARFAPNSLPAWQQLQQQGIIGTTSQQSQQIANYIQTINQDRARAQKFSESSQASEQEAEASLENVEKLSGTCQRDVVYSKAALTFSSRKNFKRASDLAGEIKDLKQSESVKEVISLDMALSAIEIEDWEDAKERLKKIISLELKLITHAKLAEALLKKNEMAESMKIISNAVELIEKLSEAKTRTGFLFGLSAILLKTEPMEAQTLLENAVKNLNKLEAEDRRYFSIPIKVSLSCQGEDKTWYGASISLSNSNVFDALTLFAKKNPDEAKLITESVNDKITKIRSLAIITKIALANEKKQSVKQL